MTIILDSAVAGSFDSYLNAKAHAIQMFPDNRFVSQALSGKATIEHYQTLLLTLFHQTRSSPYTFSMAASKCSWRNSTAKEYLLRHALEEAKHWEWILDDLEAVGYKAANPRQLLPHPSCEAYISFNERVAAHFPVARLAIAAVLEGIGATHGENYGRKLIEALSLEPKNCTFFLSHAETDKEHSAEIDELIKESDLSAEEWAWMAHAAKTAGLLYRAMYDHDGYA